MTFNTKGLMSSINQNWQTPDDLYNKLNNEFHFTFDPCPSKQTFDGLNIEWAKNSAPSPSMIVIFK